MRIIKTIVMIPVKAIAAFMFFIMSLGNRVIQTLLSRDAKGIASSRLFGGIDRLAV